MKVENMTNSRGNKVRNQFIIREEENEMSGNAVEYFQSYETIIVKRDKFRAGEMDRQVWLDVNSWNYRSRTTSKYRNQFLGETTKDTERKIKDGTYTLTDLN